MLEEEEQNNFIATGGIWNQAIAKLLDEVPFKEENFQFTDIWELLLGEFILHSRD